MKILLYSFLIVMGPIIIMALLAIGASLVKWVSKQLGKLKKYKTGKMFVKTVEFIGSLIGLLILAFLYFVIGF